MKAARNAPNAVERARLRLKFNELITFAEALKQSLKLTVDTSTETNRPLPPEERAILQKGGQLHGYVFPAWTSGPEVSEFASEGPRDVYL